MTNEEIMKMEAEVQGITLRLQALTHRMNNCVAEPDNADYLGTFGCNAASAGRSANRLDEAIGRARNKVV
jgi:hypothetical protein